MKLRVIVATLVLSSAVTLSAAIPTIESIEPSSGPVAGGTVVTLRGKNLSSSSLPCPFAFCSGKPSVRIGGKKAEVVETATDGTSIKIKTPPNAGGTYDVSFNPRDGNTIALGYVLLPTTQPTITVTDGFTYGSGGYERILVPFYAAGEVPGAFGSRWVTELVGWNPHPFSVAVYQVPPATPPSPFDSGSPDWGAPLSSFRPQLSSSGPAFLHVAGSNALAFHLRVRDVSRQSESWGTEIPVISERKAFTGEPILLNDIPFGSDARVMLRIYDFDGPTGGDVDVEVHFNDGTGNLSEQFALARVSFPGGTVQQYPPAPGYIEVDLTSELAGFPLTNNVTSLRVLVNSPHVDKRLWAFISVTNNRTQQITTVTPQH
jgi:IPT/TIG domain-containing protein